MDLKQFEDFNCKICLEPFGPRNRSPKILLCGDTFCSSCIANLLIQRPTCPTCESHISYTDVKLIPVNYLVESIVSKLFEKRPQNSNILRDCSLIAVKDSPDIGALPQATKEKAKFNGFKSEGYCGEHENDKQFRCMDCESWICGTCVVLNHKRCRTLLVDQALEEMKVAVLSRVKSKLDWQLNQNKQADMFIKAWETKRKNRQKEIKERQVELRRLVESLKSYGTCIKDLLHWKSKRNKFTNILQNHQALLGTVSSYSQLSKETLKLDDILDEDVGHMELTIPSQHYKHLTVQEIEEWSKHESSFYAVGLKSLELPENDRVIVIDRKIWIHTEYSYKQLTPDGGTFVR